MRRKPTWDTLLVALIVVIGSAGYVRVWLSDRGFWNDELYVAINVRELSMWDLTGPLMYYQSAPPGWLMALKVLYKVVGGSEYVLRFGSMLGAIVALVLTAVVARRVVGRLGAVLAVLIVAVSPMLLTYAGELKQYSVETVLALALLLVAEVYAREEYAEHSRKGRALAWALTAMVAVSFSYSAAIVFAGCFAAVIFYLSLRKRGKDVAAFAIGSIAPLALGTTLVVVRLTSPTLANQAAFFKTGYPPKGSGLLDFWTWVPDTWVGYVQSPLRWNIPLLILGLLIVGFVSLVVRKRYLWALLLFALAGVAVSGAAVHGLPLQDRVALYLVIPTIVIIVAGFDGLIRGAIHAFRAFSVRSGESGDAVSDGPSWWGRRQPATIGTAVVLAAATIAAFAGFGFSMRPAINGAYAEVTTPQYRDRGRDVILDVKSRFQPGDMVLIYGFSKPLAAWYSRRAGLPTNGLVSLRTEKSCRREGWPKVAAKAKRIWYVHGASLSVDPPDYTRRVLSAMAPKASIVDSRGFGKNHDRGLATDPGWVLLKPGKPNPNPLKVDPIGSYACLTILLDPHV